jgi:hypothetical protein
MENCRDPENKRGLITREQALELADKYLLSTGRIALKDDISVSRSVRGWQIVAKTTPIILGTETEITSFPIDMKTGEVGVSITQIVPITVSITKVLKEISERKDIDEQKREQLRTKVGELEDASKKPVDKNKMNDLKKWFENNAPYLKSIIDLITAILSKF